MSSFDYDQGDIHLRYDGARGLSDETVNLWLEAVGRHAPPASVESLVDLGCGTGRFTGALARFYAARVYAVDPSSKMLNVARERVAEPGVVFLEGSAEEIPLADDAADLVFMSMVFHHVRDHARAFGELRRVLKSDGRLVVRTGTRERLDSFLWTSFFPEALAIETNRTPPAHELIETARAHGFPLAAHETLAQNFATGLREYCEKIARRGLSSLRAIPDRAFDEGLSRLRAHCASHDTGAPVLEEIELFVFSC